MMNSGGQCIISSDVSSLIGSVALGDPAARCRGMLMWWASRMLISQRRPWPRPWQVTWQCDQPDTPNKDASAGRVGGHRATLHFYLFAWCLLFFFFFFYFIFFSFLFFFFFCSFFVFSWFFFFIQERHLTRKQSKGIIAHLSVSLCDVDDVVFLH